METRLRHTVLKGALEGIVRVGRALVAFGGVVGLGLWIIGLSGCATTGGPATDPARAAENRRIEKDWGVQVEGLRLSAAGYLIDFRYKVLDPDKASGLFLSGVQPLLVDEASGATFVVPAPPKVGPLRNARPPKAGTTYFMLFANPGRYIKPDTRVSVVIGEFEARHLVVQ